MGYRTDEQHKAMFARMKGGGGGGWTSSGTSGGGGTTANYTTPRWVFSWGAWVQTNQPRTTNTNLPRTRPTPTRSGGSYSVQTQSNTYNPINQRHEPRSFVNNLNRGQHFDIVDPPKTFKFLFTGTVFQGVPYMFGEPKPKPEIAPSDNLHEPKGSYYNTLVKNRGIDAPSYTDNAFTNEAWRLKQLFKAGSAKRVKTK